ncbi:serine/arginine-rich SC35-like splicing factor SCL33 [Histomonas meleagridis]|uniref:serine/arginine-rich SC35-like splicing factor SCL33 n=1 Tax=Histomonas meleagridis TaxID=135588 RepID=UPI003559D938|nr:serine/arginine-rich SC35-like splicing factor SCL33 [Histomonas meleagridis]KAH0802270.1 serine/arginine-rich SC35-like splicing factor SCL33 [Histomonas meleagridis]
MLEKMKRSVKNIKTVSIQPNKDCQNNQMSDSEIYETNEIEFPWEGRILVVSNLSYDVRPSDLRDHFAKLGKIYRVDIERNKHGESNGLGFIEFASPSDCNTAAEQDGLEFQGRKLKCKVALKPPAELVRFYIRDINKRQVSERIRQRIIDESQNGQPEPTPIPKRIRKTLPYKRRYDKPPSSKHHSKDYSSDYYSSPSYSYSSGYSGSDYSDYNSYSGSYSYSSGSSYSGSSYSQSD